MSVSHHLVFWILSLQACAILFLCAVMFTDMSLVGFSFSSSAVRIYVRRRIAYAWLCINLVPRVLRSYLPPLPLFVFTHGCLKVHVHWPPRISTSSLAQRWLHYSWVLMVFCKFAKQVELCNFCECDAKRDYWLYARFDGSQLSFCCTLFTNDLNLFNFFRTRKYLNDNWQVFICRFLCVQTFPISKKKLGRQTTLSENLFYFSWPVNVWKYFILFSRAGHSSGIKFSTPCHRCQVAWTHPEKYTFPPTLGVC